MTVRDEIRPLQPLRGRSVQGIKAKLDRALDRPQCLVFGLPGSRPMFSGTEAAFAWDGRAYSWQYRAGNITAPLSIKTHCAPPRHRFSRITVAIDLLPIYVSGANANPESFEATAARGALGELGYQIDIFQGGVFLAQAKSGREVTWVPTNYQSESHILRTIGLQHYDVDRLSGFGFGVNLAYSEGTFDGLRDIETELVRIRESIDLPTYNPELPVEIAISSVPLAAGAWLDGNTAGLWGLTEPDDDYCSIWALALSAWGHP